MKYKLFQLKRKFLGLGTHFDSLERLKAKNIKVDLKNYDVVYEGTLDGDNEEGLLEVIFYKFNMDFPDNYNGRSMSVSDIVRLNDEYYFCDSIGWKKISF